MAITDLPVALAPHAEPTAPTTTLPDGSCDAHVHIMADPSEYALLHRAVERPAPGRLLDWLDRFEIHLRTLGLSRTVLVHSILFGTDNSLTLEALRLLGRERARAVVLVGDDVTDAELDTLADVGAIGVRLNYIHGGVLSWDGVKAMAPRLAARGMHVQMLMSATEHLRDIAADVRSMPVPVVFDHLGWPDLAVGTEDAGFVELCHLLGEGRAWVKLSGAYRLCDAPYSSAADVTAALVDANPEHCVWGSDWPHVMLADAKMPDAGVLLEAFLDAVPSENTRRRILVDNPARLYRF